MRDKVISANIIETYKECSLAYGERSPIPIGIFIRDFYRHYHTINLVHRFAPLSTDTEILDVCAGFAVPSRILQKEGYKIYVTDSYTIGGEAICSVTAKTFPFTRINNIETDKLPFSENSFDCVLWLGTIEHLQNSPKRVLDWIYKILRPNGIVVIDTPNILELRKRIMLMLGKSFMPPIQFVFHSNYHADHHREYTKSDLEYVLQQSNFKICYSGIVDTVSPISIERRTKIKDRIPEKSELLQMTQFSIGWKVFSIDNLLKFPYSLALKLVPSFKDTLFIVGRKMYGKTGLINCGNAKALRTMTDRVVHRGPGDSGIECFSESRVSVGYRRFSIDL